MLVGDRFGAELAWELAAARPDRFTGLVVIDRGHPGFPTRTGWSTTRTARRSRSTPPHCSPPGGAGVAKASQRYVYSDYRLVEFAARRNAAVGTAQLAAEIVLRTSSW